MSKKEITTEAHLKAMVRDTQQTRRLVSDLMIEFFQRLRAPQVPKGFVLMNPYANPETMLVVNAFYKKYYGDNSPRTLMLGINPGRFGAGITGISFTDPIRLERDCGIPTRLIKKPELSSDFIYRMIHIFGGPVKFYGQYLISAVSPLGFTSNGKNINYYDDKRLQASIRPFAAACISRLLAMGINRQRCFCIGEGKNHDFLCELNEEHRWFDRIIPLAHPRFIMQYRRRKLDEYINVWLDQLD